MISSSVVFLHKHGTVNKTSVDFDGYKTHGWTLKGKTLVCLKCGSLMFSIPSNLVELVVYPNAKQDPQHNKSQLRAAWKPLWNTWAQFPALTKQMQSWWVTPEDFLMIHFIIAVNNPRGALLLTPVGEAAL